MTGAKAGTCPVCDALVPIVNYTRTACGFEVGYLGRHRRRGVRRDASCSGSFGSWVGKVVTA